MYARSLIARWTGDDWVDSAGRGDQVAIENVSSASDIHCTHFTRCTIGCRTVAEIQGKFFEKREWNSLSWLAHAKNNKYTIATWKLNLTRTIQTLDVR